MNRQPACRSALFDPVRGGYLVCDRLEAMLAGHCFGHPVPIASSRLIMETMKKTCKKCTEEFEWLPDSPGFIDVCSQCSGRGPETIRQLAAEIEARKSYAAAIRSNNQRSRKLRESDRKFAELGYERVPGKTWILEMPK